MAAPIQTPNKVFDKPIVVPPEFTEILKAATNPNPTSRRRSGRPASTNPKRAAQSAAALFQQQLVQDLVPTTLSSSAPTLPSATPTPALKSSDVPITPSFKPEPQAAVTHTSIQRRSVPGTNEIQTTEPAKVVYVPVLVVTNPNAGADGRDAVSVHLITNVASAPIQTPAPFTKPQAAPALTTSLAQRFHQSLQNPTEPMEGRLMNAVAQQNGAVLAIPATSPCSFDAEDFATNAIPAQHPLYQPPPQGVSPSSSLGSMSGLAGSTELPAGAEQKKTPVDSSRYKTTLCRKFETHGFCPYGDICAYAHGVKELRSVEDNTSAAHSLAILAGQLKAKLGPTPMSAALGPVRRQSKKSPTIEGHPFMLGSPSASSTGGLSGFESQSHSSSSISSTTSNFTSSVSPVPTSPSDIFASAASPKHSELSQTQDLATARALEALMMLQNAYHNPHTNPIDALIM